MKELFKLFSIGYVISYLALFIVQIFILNYQDLNIPNTHIILIWASLPVAIVLSICLRIFQKLENKKERKIIDL